MTTKLFLFGAAVLAIALWAMRSQKNLTTVLRKHTAKGRYPELLSVTLMAIQASELVAVVEHANLVNLTVAGILLVMLVAVRSGTEGENH